MEPVFPILRESAGVAAAIALDTVIDVQDVRYPPFATKRRAASQVPDPPAARYGEVNRIMRW